MSPKQDDAGNEKPKQANLVGEEQPTLVENPTANKVRCIHIYFDNNTYLNKDPLTSCFDIPYRLHLLLLRAPSSSLMRILPALGVTLKLQQDSMNPLLYKKSNKNKRRKHRLTITLTTLNSHNKKKTHKVM